VYLLGTTHSKKKLVIQSVQVQDKRTKALASISSLHRFLYFSSSFKIQAFSDPTLRTSMNVVYFTIRGGYNKISDERGDDRVL